MVQIKHLFVDETVEAIERLSSEQFGIQNLPGCLEAVILTNIQSVLMKSLNKASFLKKIISLHVYFPKLTLEFSRVLKCPGWISIGLALNSWINLERLLSQYLCLLLYPSTKLFCFFYAHPFLNAFLNILFLLCRIFSYPFVFPREWNWRKNKSFSVKLPDTCIILHIKSQLTLTKRWLSTAPCLLCAYTCLCSGFMLSENAQSSFAWVVSRLTSNHSQWDFDAAWQFCTFLQSLPSAYSPAQLLIPQICAF